MTAKKDAYTKKQLWDMALAWWAENPDKIEWVGRDEFTDHIPEVKVKDDGGVRFQLPIWTRDVSIDDIIKWYEGQDAYKLKKHDQI